jgi:hypothetical protein
MINMITVILIKVVAAVLTPFIIIVAGGACIELMNKLDI